MQYFSSACSIGAKMLLACLIAAQLAACGSGGDAVETAAFTEEAGIGGSKSQGRYKKTDDGTTPETGESTDGSDTTAVGPSGISQSDPRISYWIDPRKQFADQRKWGAVTQITGPNQPLADIREPGVIGAGDDYTFSRVADPLDPQKAAFRHRLSGSFPTWGKAGARRSEVTANWSNDGTNLTRGTDYWIAFAIKFDPDMFGAGNGTVSLLDFHQVPDDGENWLPSSLSMYGGEDGMSFVVRWDAGQPTVSSNPPKKSLWHESSPSTTQWHRFAMKVRLHWDVSQKPYVQIWRAVGNGPVQQIVSYEGPNDYNNIAPYIPQKFGLYRWDAWSGKDTRTIFTKGFYVLKDQAGSPAIDAQTMIRLLGEI